MVPEGWEVKPLSEITKEKISYGIVQAGPHDPDGVPYIKSSDVRGVIESERLKRTSEEIHYKYRRSAVHPGDIVFSLRGNIGESAIVPPELPEANLTQGTARISVSGLHNNLFHFYQLASAPLLNRVNALSKGSTFKEISLEELRKVRVFCPPLPEQKKIAQILSTWDQAITATQHLLENSQQRKKGLMQQLLTGKKRLPGFEGEWKTVELGSLGSTYSGLSGKTKEDFGDGEPFVTYMGVFSDGALKTDRFDYVRLSEGESQNKVQYGDILFTTSSETPEEVGMASVLLENLPYNLYLNSFCFGFRPHSFEDLVPEYARYLFRGEEMRRRISALAQGATRYNLSKKQLIKLDVLLPGKAEQTAISKVLATSDTEISAVRYRLIYLRDEKKALMQQLLTGKRRVKLETEAA